MKSIDERNRALFERCKKLGDAVYAEDVGLVLRPNIEVTLKDRWGFDVVQSSAWYASSLARWCVDHPDDADEPRHRLNRLVRVMAASQDRDPGSETHGNIYWRVGWTEIRDRNGVSFWSPEAGRLYLQHRDLLDTDTLAELERALELCVTGLDLHRPRWQYTNIFLLNILSRLTLARALDRADVLSRAEEDWQTWYTETAKGGLTEYNSPTYIVTALVPLGRMLPFAPEAMAAEVERALHCLYADFCWHYHPPSAGLAGAMSRAYSGDWLHNSLTNHVAYQQFGEPHTAVNLTAPFTAASAYLAPADVREFATRDKSGTTVDAAIPDLGIRRRTAFGRSWALGVKSGPAYGHQELPLTIAHPGRRQHLVYLHNESPVSVPTHAALETGRALVVLDIPESDAGAAPPHAWLKLRLGPADEFETFRLDDADWDGDYVDVAGRTVGLRTPEIVARLAFGVFSGTVDTTKVFLWNDYQTDQVTVEIVAWKPARVAITVAVSDGGDIPSCSPAVRTEDRFASNSLVVSLDAPPSETPELLKAPGFVWRSGWTIDHDASEERKQQ